MFIIVCLGDSITCEWEEPHYPSFWQTLLDQKYGQDKIKVIAAGVNGETAQDGYHRLDTDVFPHHPDLVTVMYGHNEVHQGLPVSQYRQSLVQIVTRLKPIPTWFLSPNQIDASPMAKLYLPYLQATQAVAVDQNIPYLDLWSVFAGQDLSQIFTYTIDIITPPAHDYLHPNELGHQLIAQFLMKQLTRTINL